MKACPKITPASAACQRIYQKCTQVNTYKKQKTIPEISIKNVIQ